MMRMKFLIWASPAVVAAGVALILAATSARSEEEAAAAAGQSNCTCARNAKEAAPGQFVALLDPICTCPLFPYAQFPTYWSYYAEQCEGIYLSYDGPPELQMSQCCGGDCEITGALSAGAFEDSTDGHYSVNKELGATGLPEMSPVLEKLDVRNHAQQLSKNIVQFSNPDSPRDITAQVFLVLVDPAKAGFQGQPQILGIGNEVDKKEAGKPDFILDKDSVKQVAKHCYILTVGAASYQVLTCNETTAEADENASSGVDAGY